MISGTLALCAALLSFHLPAGTNVGASAGLAAAAAASGRPPECLSGSRRALAKGPSIWERARTPNLSLYCDRMARAHTELATSPEKAKAAALEADQALPGRPSPHVMVARASFALGALDEAQAAFERARALDPRSVEDPATMHDWARVLVRTQRRDEALAVYRALVPRVDLLGTEERRVAALLEAAHVSMAAEGIGSASLPANVGSAKKPEATRLDETIAYLREARHYPATSLTGDVLLSLALALDRNGDQEQADAALGEAQRAFQTAHPGARGYLAVKEDELALAALSAEGVDRAAAQKAWESYLGGPGGKGRWAKAARARLELLKKGGGGPRPLKASDIEQRPPKPRGSR